MASPPSRPLSHSRSRGSVSDTCSPPMRPGSGGRMVRAMSMEIREKWLLDFARAIEESGATEQLVRPSGIREVHVEQLEALDLADDECVLVLPNKKAYALPVVTPTVGHPCIDVRQLYAKLGYTTFDPGFVSTASCWSAITFIDGGKGQLLHRGYSIQDLCDNCDFVELSFLLMYGELPSIPDKEEHVQQLKSHMLVHQKIIHFYQGFRYNAHPMAIMTAVVGALSSFYHEELDITNPDHRLLCAYRVIAKMPVLAAMAYKTSVGQPINFPKKKYSYAANLLYMMFANPTEEYEPDPVQVKALDKFLMLHADHEQNASTSTVRIAGSSHANPYACIASGVTALWGPAHGGANEAVINMLHEIGSKDNIPHILERAKNKKDPFRLMGFGHRVYKNYDPRAKVMQKMCHELLASLQGLGQADEPLLELAMELEKAALSDEYFIKRKLFPNVDFYSGIVLRALGIPLSMYTVLFAVGRAVGWISHWKEMIEDPKQRIGRPRQLYIGEGPREFVPPSAREVHVTSPRPSSLGGKK